MIETFVRAVRGTVRYPVRTLIVVVLLAAGLSFALTSLALAFAAGDELDKIKRVLGVQAGVSINPDQFSRAIQEEFQRSSAAGEPFDSRNIPRSVTFLNGEQAEEIAALPYVERLEVFTVAAPEYELPDRPAGRENDLVLGNLRISLPDAILTGTRDPTFIPDFQVGTKELREGRLFTPDDAGRDVVIIDQDTAAFEELEVGDTIVLVQELLPPEDKPDVEPQTRRVEAEIVGIYADLAEAAQGGFNPASIQAWYAPIETVRHLQDDENQDLLTAMALILDSVDSVELLKADLGSMLDEDLFLVTTTEERFQAISDPLETMRNTSVVGTIAGLAVVGLVMVLLMALIVRGRLREIGILKAVGARNRHVVAQFALETVGIAIVAVVVAVPISLGTNAMIADAFRGSPDVEERSQNNTGLGGPNLGSGQRALTDAPVIDDPVRTEEVEAILREVNAEVGPDVIALAAVIAVALGLLGALVPIVATLRLRPAEVLRLEA